MNSVKRIFILAGTMMFFVFAGQPEPPSELTFEDWDKNGNNFISRSEFVDVFMNNFIKDWNVVDDGYFDDEDVFKRTFYIWDYDNNNLLSHDEWMYGYDYYFGNYIFDDYEVTDADGDGSINYEEYYNALVDSDYYKVWDEDGDGKLNKHELARMIFNNWDYNNSNFIELDEFNQFKDYYLKQ